MSSPAISPAQATLDYEPVDFPPPWRVGTLAYSRRGLVSALINDVVPHLLIGRFFGLFRIIGLSAGIVFNYYLMDKAEAYYRLLLVSLALLYGAGFVLMCVNVREGEYPPPPKPEDVSHGRLSPLISYFKECFTHPYYLWFFIATTLGGMSMAPANTFSVFHAHSVGMSNGTYGKCIALSYVFSLLLSYPLGLFADRFHPVRTGMLFAAIYCAATLFGFFYALTAARFFVALFLHTVISVFIIGSGLVALSVISYLALLQCERPHDDDQTTEKT